MRFSSQTSSDGVTEQPFTFDEIPGVLWTPEDAHGTRPLILLGHGGGQHKTAPSAVSRARRYAAEGFAIVGHRSP
jgi:dipeptidyl aminopeptidase/acylaminoacyl peptidase